MVYLNGRTCDEDVSRNKTRRSEVVYSSHNVDGKLAIT